MTSERNPCTQAFSWIDFLLQAGPQILKNKDNCAMMCVFLPIGRLFKGLTSEFEQEAAQRLETRKRRDVWCFCFLKLGLEMTWETQDCSLNGGSEICSVSSPTLQSRAISAFICLLQHLFIWLACLYRRAPCLLSLLPVQGCQCHVLCFCGIKNQDRQTLQGKRVRAGVN